jgi:phosphatidylserine decarboxylase
MSKAFIFLQHVLPQQVLSRMVGKVAECKSSWLKNFLIRRFIGRYGVDMREALHEAPEHYENFNSFFTRALKPGLRPLPDDPLAVVSPADGAISAIGPIEDASIFQAKGKHFSLQALLGGNALWADQFRNGSFATVYLAPKDYHRVHMPYAGTLTGMVYVPGQLFSVNQVTAENIDHLFARNERAVCLFDTEKGPMAVILVGAMIVAGIETVWAGQVAPANNKVSGAPEQHAGVCLARGAEMGRFKLGSTAILLFGPGMQSWGAQLQTGSSLRMGQQIGRMLN